MREKMTALIKLQSRGVKYRIRDFGSNITINKLIKRSVFNLFDIMTMMIKRIIHIVLEFFLL